MKAMRARSQRDGRVLDIVSYAIGTIMAILCVIPVALIIVASFTDNLAILRNGYSLFPEEWSILAYQYIFANRSAVVRAYIITILITIIGSMANLFVTSMAGYVLSRKDFKYRNKFSFFFYFTTLFSGGMVPFYVLVASVLNLKDSFLAVILPALTTPFLIILMRSFISSSVPDSLTEAMHIDGANDFRIYRQLILPLSTSALATIGLFEALYYWNNWYLAMLFLNRPKDYPLQYYLHTMMSVEQMAADSGAADNIQYPGESIKMAMAVVTTLPIMAAYPFVQKYFARGLTIGAVKE